MTDLRTWSQTAAPGETIEYFRGHLAAAAQCRGDIATIRRAASDLYLTGGYEMIQRRVAEGFAYLIVKRRTQDTTRRFWYRTPASEAQSPSPHSHRGEARRRAA